MQLGSCHTRSFAPGKVRICGQSAGKDPAAGRTLLREGAFEGLRDNVKALGEYAVANGTAKDASTLAGAFFMALEAYDYRCIHPRLTHPASTLCPPGHQARAPAQGISCDHCSCAALTCGQHSAHRMAEIIRKFGVAVQIDRPDSPRSTTAAPCEYTAWPPAGYLKRIVSAAPWRRAPRSCCRNRCRL